MVHAHWQCGAAPTAGWYGHLTGGLPSVVVRQARPSPWMGARLGGRAPASVGRHSLSVPRRPRRAQQPAGPGTGQGWPRAPAPTRWPRALYAPARGREGGGGSGGGQQVGLVRPTSRSGTAKLCGGTPELRLMRKARGSAVGKVLPRARQSQSQPGGWISSHRQVMGRGGGQGGYSGRGAQVRPQHSSHTHSGRRARVLV